MMIGMGTPSSQSRMPRPMESLLSADIPWIYIADRRIWFLPGSSSAEPEFVEAHLLGIAAAHLFDTAGLLSALHL
jgi:hypothetical protein